ncbi:acetylcholinesterase-like [Haemaphysalis longicornis]
MIGDHVDIFVMGIDECAASLSQQLSSTPPIFMPKATVDSSTRELLQTATFNIDEAEKNPIAVPASNLTQPGPSNLGKQQMQASRSEPSSRPTRPGIEPLPSYEKGEQRRRLCGGVPLELLSLATLGSVLFFMLLLNSSANAVVLRVPGVGAFRGLRTYVEGRPVYVFRGIRFGESTAGASRFAKPTAARADKETVTDARSSRVGCLQLPYVSNNRIIRHNENTSEDCLHLNVWTPCTEEKSPGCRKTVLVFFHGQDFQWGDNNYYDGQWLAGLGQVVVVTPNFRLGAFGFLHIGCPGNVSESNIEGVACAPGNVALDDQRLAVEWIVAHIRSFGGNSTDIVLLGSGSGAWSVGAHMLGATARGASDQFWKHERFRKVILMSESPLRR